MFICGRVGKRKNIQRRQRKKVRMELYIFEKQQQQSLGKIKTKKNRVFFFLSVCLDVVEGSRQREKKYI